MTCSAPLTVRPIAHSRVHVCSRCKQHETENSSLLLNDVVERKSFKSVGSRFQARGATTEKALSPIFRLVLSTTMNSLLHFWFHFTKFHFFSERVINRWNCLPPNAVKATSANSFKARLDKVRKTQTSFFMDTGSVWRAVCDSKITPFFSRLYRLVTPCVCAPILFKIPGAI